MYWREEQQKNDVRRKRERNVELFELCECFSYVFVAVCLNAGGCMRWKFGYLKVIKSLFSELLCVFISVFLLACGLSFFPG